MRENQLGWVYVSPVDVVLSPEEVVQPDVTFISAAKGHLLTKPNIQGAPDLMIEILSEATRKLDQIIKRQRYAHFGVLEYWIVDPTIELVAVYRRAASALERVLEISTETGGTLTSPLLPGLSIGIAAFLRRSEIKRPVSISRFLSKSTSLPSSFPPIRFPSPNPLPEGDPSGHRAAGKPWPPRSQPRSDRGMRKDRRHARSCRLQAFSDARWFCRAAPLRRGRSCRID
ncbi:MAG: uncharacterized protein JWN02_1030 [Acidobacteria bacterium]|nr:uncharacterized protein [Acidobacteriota bacterium]